MSRFAWCSLFVIALIVVCVQAFSMSFADLVLQGNPVHLGDTYNSVWSSCSPQVPFDPLGECYTV